VHRVEWRIGGAQKLATCEHGTVSFHKHNVQNRFLQIVVQHVRANAYVNQPGVTVLLVTGYSYVEVVRKATDGESTKHCVP